MPLFNYEELDQLTYIYEGDCLEVLPELHSKGIKVDMVLTDPPFGTTNCRWDSVIDVALMWQGINSVVNENTPVLLFCQQPFTSTLGTSNISNLRYNWVWEKTQATGHLNAKKMPMKCHEDILVFYKKLPRYYPIKTSGHKRKIITAEHKRKCNLGEIYQDYSEFTDYDSTERYPRSIIQFKSDKQTNYLFSTQKPVALLEYLIKTYTIEGDTVLDFAMGSGSTGIACQNTGRKFIGVEKNTETYKIAYNRLKG